MYFQKVRISTLWSFDQKRCYKEEIELYLGNNTNKWIEK